MRPARLALLTALLAAVSVPVLAAVDIRGGDHGRFGRLVFEWDAPTPYTLVQDGRTVRLVFQKPVGSNPAKALRPLTGYISQIATDGANVTLTLKRDLDVSHSRNGKLVILDFRQAKQSPAKSTASVTQVTPPPPPEPTPPSPPKENPAPQPAAQPAHVTVTPAPAAPAPDAPPLPSGNTLTPTVKGTPTNLGLGFPWMEETRLAAFRRAGAWWVVFDRPARFDLSPLRQSPHPFLTRVEQLPHPTATVLRLQVKPDMGLGIWRRGTAWQVDIRPQTGKAESDITLVPTNDPSTGATQIRVSLPGLGAPVRVVDPAVGDQLWVAGGKDPNTGTVDARKLPEFALPATLQGVAVQSNAPDLGVQAVEDGLLVSLPTGLNIAARPQDDATTDPLAPAPDGRLFHFGKWHKDKGKPFLQQRQRLQQAVIDAPAKQKNRQRLVLAEFLLANGYAHEALGIMEMISRDDPMLPQLPAFRALKGAALILRGKPDEGLALLQDERLNTMPEVYFWRGAALAMLGDTDAARSTLAKGPGGLPSGYVPHLAMALGVPVAEVWLEGNDLARAGKLIDDLGGLDLTTAQRSRVTYLSALRMRRENKPLEARRLLDGLERSQDHWSRTRAAFTLVQMGLADKGMTPEQAIAQLEKLRFAWRGDSFEFRIQRTLGELLVSEGNYRYGFRVLQQAAERFPNHPETPQLQQLMADTFRRLYLNGDADRMTPVQALSLFDEFRQLTPEDASGDQMIRNLADRLVAVDLLTRAGNLLSHQIRERVQGEEKGRVGARLALIKLLDRKPEDAINALNLSNVEEIPDELRHERRLLRARALLMQEKSEDALGLLEGDYSVAADRIRAEIYWERESYPLLVGVLERLVTVPQDAQAVTDKQAQGLVNLAMALSLNQDYDKLAQLRRVYTAAMAKSPYHSLFEVISRPPEETNVSSYAAISSQFAEIRQFESFLEDYRQKLKNGELKMN